MTSWFSGSKKNDTNKYLSNAKNGYSFIYFWGATVFQRGSQLIRRKAQIPDQDMTDTPIALPWQIPPWLIQHSDWTWPLK